MQKLFDINQPILIIVISLPILGCVWSQWAGVGTCSEPCGIGQQKYTREQSPWGVAKASECQQTQTETKECILAGCTGISIFNCL